ncbi:YqgE/AlgH family protein [Parabacteroides sp.]
MASYNNIFKITHNNVLPAQGSILISEPFLQDAYFQRAVVLLIEHNKEGSMGFVLNKKTDLIVNSFFPELESFPEMPIYLGGPVTANRLFFIHSLGDLIIPDSVKIKDQLYFDGDFEALKRYILNGHSIDGKVKFFLGYSGWTEGQLGNEINHNSWVVSHASKGNVLLADGDSFWKNSLEQLGSNYKAWTKYPKDPYLN